MKHPSLATILRKHGFTLVEMLIAMTLLAVILLVSAGFINQMASTWTKSSARIEQFREARMAFETVTQSLRQTTLNVYTTYQYNGGTTPTVPTHKSESPKRYIRHSELQFVTGQAAKLMEAGSGSLCGHAVFFQARLGVTNRDGYAGLNRLLCGRGYFISYGDDDAYRPTHVAHERRRFRLWEFRPPAESNAIYTPGVDAWYARAAQELVKAGETGDKPSQARPVAENIVALIISPKVTPEDAQLAGAKDTWIAPDYSFDSTKLVGATSANPQGMQHLLPPLVQVTMVAIDEGSAIRLAEEAQEQMPELIPTGAFTNCDDYARDLLALEEELLERKLNYRIFSSTIPMRNSKWNEFWK